MKHTLIKDMNLVRAIERIDATLERMEELEPKLNALFEYQGLTVREVSTGVFEVVKPTAEDMPSGDYLNPIRWVEGMSVETGKFYWYDDKDLPAEALKSGVALAWNKEWFDIVG